MRAFAPVEPILTEQFARMRRTDSAVAARQVVGSAVLVAAPADALRMGGA
jgi:hypothetical protein